MHGLIITAVRRFVLTAYGKTVWARLCSDVGVPADPVRILFDSQPHRFPQIGILSGNLSGRREPRLTIPKEREQAGAQTKILVLAAAHL